MLWKKREVCQRTYEKQSHSLLPAGRGCIPYPVHFSFFSNSFIMILNALILAYFLSTDSRICQGA